MVERGFGIRCPSCDEPYSTVEEVRGDPDRRRSVIARIRRCANCGAELRTIETLAGEGGIHVRLPDPRDVIREVRSDRYVLGRLVE